MDEATNELKKQAYAAKIKVLEKKKAALEAEFAKANPPAVDVVTEASPELREWTTAKAAQKGVPEVEFNDTGLLTDKPYGQFTPDKIEASTFAKLKRAGAEEAVTTLPEFDTEQATLFAGSKDQPSGAASTLIHEPIHAEIYNIVNSEKSGQTRIGEQLQAAVERDPRFKAWQAKEGKPWDEYLTRSTTRDILSDPMHKKRSWAEERKSLARLADGTATADDAVRIAGMKFRYDSNLAAPRAALKAAASMPAKSLTRVYEHELAKRDAQQPMEQMEFPKTAQQGTPLSKWQRDNTELPKGTFEPKLGQQDLRLSEPAASESAAPMSFEERKRAFAEDPANRKLVQSIPSEDKFDMNNWSRSGIAKFFGGDVSQQNIGQHIKKGTALAAKAGLKFDANEYFRDYNPRNKFATDAETGEKTPVALSKHTPFDKVEEE
ncbi:MAG: hypothetical protein EBU46_18255, partial [Nitrosomonadaceae bacterium]|nr:hypothetical protein [Nitrosomonadaceae bacterium]